MHRPRRIPLRDVVFCCLFLAGLACAAVPDSTPTFRPDHTALPTPAEVKSRIERRFQAFDQSANDPGLLLRDKALFDEWTEVRWALQRTSNHGQVNAALTRHGIGVPANSYFRIDLREFPQWRSLEQDLYTLRAPEILALHTDGLEERGFTPTDLAQLEQAVKGPDPLQAAESDRTQLLKQYRARLTASPVMAKKFDHQAASALAYQGYLASMDAQRRWAVAVLDKLSKRQERILLSYFLEQEGYVTYAPDEGHEARLRETQEAVASDRYTELLKQREQRQ